MEKHFRRASIIDKKLGSFEATFSENIPFFYRTVNYGPACIVLFFHNAENIEKKVRLQIIVIGLNTNNKA